jgi:hypothetical protein
MFRRFARHVNLRAAAMRAALRSATPLRAAGSFLLLR